MLIESFKLSFTGGYLLKVYRADNNCMIFIKIIIILVMLGVDIVSYIYLQSYKLIMYILMGSITVLGIFFASIYVPLYFKRISFKVSKDILSKKSGFFIKTNQTMKVSSVQYVTSIYIPLFRYIGFNFIIFNALGGHLIFSFLSKQDSSEILELIDNQINEGGS